MVFYFCLKVFAKEMWKKILDRFFFFLRWFSRDFVAIPWVSWGLGYQILPIFREVKPLGGQSSPSEKHRSWLGFSELLTT